jgi:hypothetical protein
MLGYIGSYVAGRCFGSPVRAFNQARRIYEGVVAEKGYWFDSWNKPNPYLQFELQLREAEEILTRIENKSAKRPGEVLTEDRSALHYQTALLMCALRSYDRAGRAIRDSRSQNLASASHSSREMQTHESLLLYLEGELAYVSGNQSLSIQKFSESKEIDERLGDTAGIAKNLERLQLCNAGRGLS